MIKTNISREVIIKSIYKTIDNKKLVRSFNRGEVDIKTLDKAGIKFAKPI